LTASYVCQQYKGNILLSFRGINVEINTNIALFPETEAQNLFYIVDSDTEDNVASFLLTYSMEQSPS
jgi:hypothetical protein